MNSENEESAGGRSGVICFKVPFFIINVITWIGGGALIGFAIWIVSSENEYKHLIENQNMFITYIALAAVLFTAGILGTCGALLGNKILLQSYFVIVCLVFCTLFGLVVFGMVERARMDKIIRKSWNNTNDDTRIFIQEKFDCCDVGMNNTGTKSYAHDSCFVNATTKHEVKQDCLSKLIEWFEDHQIILASGGAGVMLLLILLMVGSCWLIRKLQASRSLKRARVSPVQVGTNNNVMPLHRNHPGQVNEMVSIEEPCEESYSQVGRRDVAKTAKKQRSHQRSAWAKKTSNSPLVE